MTGSDEILEDPDVVAVCSVVVANEDTIFLKPTINSRILL
jgi:hypothetical protein